MKKFSVGDLWPMLFATVFAVALIGMPFQILAEREGPIDSMTEAIAAAAMFAIFVPLGVYTIWLIVCAVAAGLLASFLWGHLKEGMRKETFYTFWANQLSKANSAAMVWGRAKRHGIDPCQRRIEVARVELATLCVQLDRVSSEVGQPPECIEVDCDQRSSATFGSGHRVLPDTPFQCTSMVGIRQAKIELPSAGIIDARKRFSEAAVEFSY